MTKQIGQETNAFEDKKFPRRRFTRAEWKSQEFSWCASNEVYYDVSVDTFNVASMVVP